MTREHATAILHKLKLLYPGTYSGITKEDGEDLVNTWTDIFANDEYNLVSMALTACIRENKTGFAPSIGEISQKMRLISAPERMTAAEAWTLLDKAAQNSQYDFRKEFDKLPPVIQKFVGQPIALRDYSNMSAEKFDTVVRSHFLRYYNEQIAHDEELAALPETAKQYRMMLSQSSEDETKQLNE